jgi:DNA-binding NtrC family response regulator
MVRLLKMRSFPSEASETIADGWTKLETGGFGLLICRIKMSDGCGAEMIEQAWTKYGIPGLAMYGTLDSRRIAAKIPRDALRGELLMPFDAQQLFELVGTVLGAGPAAEEPQTCPDCKGAGHITLLITSTTCKRCGGKGRLTSAHATA